MAEIQVMKNILGENDRVAAENQALFAEKNVYVINLMGSPGAGKTSVLEKTMEKLKDKLKMAVIEGDLFTSKDADRIEKHGVPVIQINTAGGCHLDAPMVQKVAQKLDLDDLDLLVVENVGNLVCPAEFAVGEDVTTLHPGMDVIEVSCTKDQGLDAWCQWLMDRVAAKQKKGK